MKFVKMHGLGNDFVMLGAKEASGADLASLARAMCDRHFGIGADGLIAVLPSDSADFKMRIFNPDGSEPEMCGNGIRCAAKFFLENEPGRTAGVLRVDTLAGLLSVKTLTEKGKSDAYTVDMGAPALDPKLVPVDLPGNQVADRPISVLGREVRVTCVSMGNPHAVIFVEEELPEKEFNELGPAISTHALFPRHTNVEFVRVAGEGELIMRVWERGAGPTLACGTGACATLVAAHITGRCGKKAVVRLPGGPLLIEWLESGNIEMTGPATKVFTGEW